MININDNIEENKQLMKDKKQIVIRLDNETKQKFNIKCIKEGTNMQQVLAKYIFKYLEN